jgi:hypothetical protein
MQKRGVAARFKDRWRVDKNHYHEFTCAREGYLGRRVP